MSGEVRLEELESICSYGTTLTIKRVDTGKVVIANVRALKQSKDKRQKAKWEVFKKATVYGIQPSIETEGMKRGDHFFTMVIQAWIYGKECELAIAEYKKMLESDG